MKAGWFFLQHQELNKFTTMMLLSLVFFLDRVGLSVTLDAVLSLLLTSLSFAMLLRRLLLLLLCPFVSEFFAGHIFTGQNEAATTR